MCMSAPFNGVIHLTSEGKVFSKILKIFIHVNTVQIFLLLATNLFSQTFTPI